MAAREDKSGTAVKSSKGTGQKNIGKDPRQLEIIDNGGHPLEIIFNDVLDQCTKGKGQRHGGDSTPFYDQKWVVLANSHGNGFLTGQAAKKLDEAVTSGNRVHVSETAMDDRNNDAWEREMLGAIVYLGMALLHNRGLPGK